MRPRPQREGESDQDYRSMVEEMDRKWKAGQMGPSRSEIITRPTRDLDRYGYRETEKERGRGRFDGPRWQDQEIPQDTVWTGGSRDFDERSGTYRPGHRGDDRGRVEVTGGGPEYWKRKRQEERRDKRGGGRRGWWEEPRRPAPYTPKSGLGSDSDRFALLTGEGSRPEEAVADRFKLLTGESDYIPTPLADEVPSRWKSQYGGREEYDPQDRRFNRRFSERPRGRQPWDSDYRRDPIENDPLADYDLQEGRGKGNRGWFRTDRDPFKGDMPGGIPWPKEWGEDPRIGTPGYNPEEIPKIPAGEGPGPGSPRPPWVDSPPSNTFTDYRELPSYKSYDDTDLRKRLAALEERGPIVTQPTQDLSSITQRIRTLENTPVPSSWQEDRVKALEGKQPSWQEDRIKALEGRKPDTSWKDPLAAVQAGQTQGQEARSALDNRLAALEDYYKKDPPPPPEERLGSRYEDKQAHLNKMWEQTGNIYDPEAFARGNPWQKTKDDPTPSWLGEDREGDYVRNKDYYGTGYGAEKSWASRLPETYRKQMRDLDKEYNKPSHSAIIKGREYTAYGPAAAARLKMLDQDNIHEDEYLGHGTWTNKFGEEVTGQGKAGSNTRYFASHSGLDPEGEEYAKRFRRNFAYKKDGEITNYYKQQLAGTMSEDNKRYWDAVGGYKPEKHGKYGWGVVGTNKTPTGKTTWDEAYYPELG